MGTYTIVVKPEEGYTEKMLERIQNIEPLMDRLVDSDVLAILEENYAASGIKWHTQQRVSTGTLKAGVTKRGAKGNYIIPSKQGARVGVSYDAIPYARFVIEGRGPLRAKRAKALHFWLDGKEFFRKSVGPAPPHPIYYLTEVDLDRLGAKLSEMIGE